MSYVTLNNIPADSAQVTIPEQGCWVAMVEGEGLPREGVALLRVGDMSLTGRINSAISGVRNGRMLSVVVGGLGWSRRAKAKHYHNDAGVKASTVLEDLAGSVSERLGDEVPGRLGTAWVRQEGVASATLSRIAPTWYVGLDGLTRTQPRPRIEVEPGLELLSYHPTLIRAELKTIEPGKVPVGSILREGLDIPVVVASVTVAVKSDSVTVLASGRHLV